MKVSSLNGTASLILLFAFLAAPAQATPGRATATGTVSDAAGKPVADATVLVYSAGVRKGYSIFCPTCYADCGKRTQTDGAGHFTIAGLDDELKFNLLVVKDGFAPTWIRALDPLQGSAAPTSLAARTPIDDPQRVVRGKVADGGGTAVPYALVEVDGATFIQGGQRMTQYGGLDTPIAVTNERGEFELPYTRPVLGLILRVSARAMAPAMLSASTGPDAQIIKLTDGASIHGRLLRDGKPLAGVEIGLRTVTRMSGATYPEQLVSTDEKGRFMFTNVPPRRVWDLYAKMDSLAGNDAMSPIQCATERDGQDVDVGDLRMQKGVTLSGRVELTDGKPVAQGMRLLVQSSSWDTQVTKINTDGTFSVHGLMPGGYTLIPSIRGYRVPDGTYLEVLARHDVRNYVVRLEPEAAAPN